MAVGFSTIIVAWARSFNDFEVQANSLERIQSYLQIDQEQKNLHQDDPPQLWPQSGTLSVVGLSSRYSLDGPKVLDDVSFHAVSGERIGVIGKTGSGKTSLILSLIRGIPTEGIVSFDGIPINTVNLGTWRSKVSVIPQTPALMSGTLRQNLDPYSEYDDPSLNSALESAGFFAFKRTDDSRRFTLDTPISNGGTDISVGQRQMIALILIGTLATSAIDFETESLIQSSLRRSFREDVTVIIVAHRLRTVMDLDKIMVLDSGRLIEFDSPSKLLADGRSRLRSLVDQSTDLDRDILLRLAGTSGFKYLPGPKYDPENPAGDDFAASPVLVYDYATGGDTVVGVRSQIQSIYLPSLTRDDGPVISSNDSLFVIWFGINDCAYSSDPSLNMKVLAEQLEQLYNTEPGARNVLFIDVPPINRSPAYKGNGGSQSARNRFLRWNEALNATIKEFASKYPDSTILLYSSYVIFSAFLDKPEEYGFEAGDTTSAFSRIWFDQLHPTSKVHDILAKDLAAFLKGVVAKRD
ncbi:hypothetical protein ONZ45_g14692 [Pleurotus djamor]|nr:hypothetical protein ONZ45_g14692 [Pleurotus djamor]